jgi:hypothetical protein
MDGAEIMTGGSRLGGELADGYYIAPGCSSSSGSRTS